MILTVFMLSFKDILMGLLVAKGPLLANFAFVASYVSMPEKLCYKFRYNGSSQLLKQRHFELNSFVRALLSVEGQASGLQNSFEIWC